MEQYPVEDLQEQNAIERIKLDKKKSVIVKQSMMAEVRKSFAQRKNSSIKTILSLSNMMVGSAVLVLPLQFYRSGYGSCLMAIAIMGFFTCLTARALSFQLKSEEKDFTQTIERVLGKKWQTLYSIASQAFLWLGGIVYFLLASNILYSIIIQISDSPSMPKKSDIVWDKFSYQWTGAILVVVSLVLFNLRDLSVVLKLSSKGIYSIGFFFIFITFLAIKSIIRGGFSFGYEGNTNDHEIFFTGCGFKSFLQALGVFSLSFVIHNIVSPVMKSNKNQKKNPRDVGFAWMVGSFILMFAGMVGLMGTFWRGAGEGPDRIDPSNANTIMDIFDNSDKVTFYFLIISEILLCMQLMSVLPVIAFLARTQLFTMIYGQDGIPSEKAFYGFSISYAALLYAFEIYNIKPILLIELAGTVGGFIIAYLIPISVHVKEIIRWNKKTDNTESSTDENIVTSHNVNQNETSEPMLAKISSATLFAEDQKENKSSPIVQYVFYSIVLLYGLFLIAVQFSGVEC